MVPLGEMRELSRFCQQREVCPFEALGLPGTVPYVGVRCALGAV